MESQPLDHQGSSPFPFFFKTELYFIIYYLFIYFIFILAVLGLHCCMQAFSSCGERGLLFVAMRGLLLAVPSLVAEHRL